MGKFHTECLINGSLEDVFAYLTEFNELALSSLGAARSLELIDDEKAAVADEFAHVTELVNQAQ